MADLPELPKVYIYCAARTLVDLIGTEWHMVAVSEDGELLGSHICSHPSFAMGDLHNQRGRHQAYIDKFGGWGSEYYRVVLVPDGEEPPAELMERIRLKNEEADGDGE